MLLKPELNIRKEVCIVVLLIESSATGFKDSGAVPSFTKYGLLIGFTAGFWRIAWF